MVVNKKIKPQYGFYFKEYDMLKDAHFQTSQRITTFFQYALLIFSAPLVLLTSDFIEKSLLGIVFLFIGVVGFFVMLYLNQLRAESLMYARTINQIRKNIYNELYKCTNDINRINMSLVILSQDKKPKYFDSSQFIFVVIVLGLFDSFYFGFGIYTIIPLPGIYCKWMVEKSFFVSLISAICWFVLHMISFKWMSNYNESGSAYFKRIIGVDIDGVLNKYEEHFANIYNKIFCGQNGREELKASSINTLPFFESGIISKEDEYEVYKRFEYWDAMPVNDECATYLIQEIKKELGYKVHIFTFRDCKVCYKTFGEKIDGYSINKQTRKWLKDKGIIYNKIYFEKGNIDRPVKVFDRKYKTRFYFSAQQNIKYFVEDNIHNAERLSHICKYVFLFNNEYNKNVTKDLPYNVVRVSTWREMLNKIKELD